MKESKFIRSILEQEIGTVYKRGSKINVALIYPNSYYVGMSNLGFHTIYHELNKRDDTSCERAFFSIEGTNKAGSGRRGAGTTSLEHGKIKVACPLFSLEHGRLLTDFDILAFSISFELDYPNVIQILNCINIPVRRADRTMRHPLIIAGGIFTSFNLMPLSKIVDLFIVGEGEEVIHEFMDLYSSFFPLNTIARKDEFLNEASRIEGVFVPGISNTVHVRRLKDLDKFDTRTRIVTPYTEFKGAFLIEVSRGCSRMCKFCVTGFACGKVRIRSHEKILKTAKEGLKWTSRIGLVGAAVSDHPEIDMVCKGLREMGARISVSSLRADSATPFLVKSLAESGQKTITIAPEAGTERLRRFIGKSIKDIEIIDFVEMAHGSGIKRVKMYFMLGLPGENEEDINGIISLCKRAVEILPIRVSITPFIPKPKTPFQNEKMEDKNILKKKMRYIRSQLARHRKVSITQESIRMALLEARFACGGEDVLNFLY